MYVCIYICIYIYIYIHMYICNIDCMHVKGSEINTQNIVLLNLTECFDHYVILTFNRLFIL